MEALFELRDLPAQRRRIGDIASEYFNRDGATVAGAQQTEHDLQLVAPAITAVTAPRQRTGASLEIA